MSSQVLFVLGSLSSQVLFVMGQALATGQLERSTLLNVLYCLEEAAQHDLLADALRDLVMSPVSLLVFVVDVLRKPVKGSDLRAAVEKVLVDRFGVRS